MNLTNIYEEVADSQISSVDFLLKSIKKSKPLTTSEEYDLWQRMRQGDEKARDLLITSNIPYVVSVAKEYYRKCKVSFEDLIGAGCEGLVIAVDRFDGNQGFRLISYAHWYIRQGMLNLIKNDCNSVGCVSLDKLIHVNDNLCKTINDTMKGLRVYEADWYVMCDSIVEDVKEVARKKLFESAARVVDDYITMTTDGYSIEDVAKKHGLTPGHVRRLLRKLGKDCCLGLKTAA